MTASELHGMGDPDSMPWPDVPECQAHKGEQTCGQCGGTHGHLWVTWRLIPVGHPLADGSGLPTRCQVCGARKCDLGVCWERRHHQGPHTNIDGVVIAPIGAPRRIR